MNDPAHTPEFAYDRVAYPAFIIEGLTPDRLRSAAMLHGWRTAETANARFLEIGSGEGINLIGAAAVTPGARFVGFDLSSIAIERGRELAEAAGLTNIDLHFGDVLTYPRDGEKFDYIICHGLMSWVPPVVRQAIVELIAARLAPGGIAYLSFDCLPGALAKAAIARFLRAQVGDVDGPVEAATKAGRVIAMLNRNQRKSSRLQGQLDYLITEMPRQEPGYFFHDWLAEHYAPVDLRQLIAAAAASNLEIAGSAGNYDLFTDDLDPDGKDLLAAIGDDHGERLLALDMLHGGHIFHRDLLVRSDAPPPTSTDAVADLSFAYEGTREEVERDGQPAIKYFLNDERTMLTANPATKAVLDCLHGAGSNEVGYGEIKRHSGVADDDQRDILYGLCALGLITAHAAPQNWVLHPGERPRAGQLARTMLALGERAVTQRGTGMMVPQAESQYCLVLCDGTRTREQIAADMSAAFETEVPLAKLTSAIDYFARQRVFEA